MTSGEPARPILSPKGFECSACGAPLEPGAIVCPECKRPLALDVIVPRVNRRAAPPSPITIGWMWALTVFAAFLYAAAGAWPAAVADTPALLLAAILFQRGHPTDRLNGAVKLGLDGVVVAASLLLGAG